MVLKAKYMYGIGIATQVFNFAMMLMIVCQHFVHNGDLGYKMPAVMGAISVMTGMLTTLSMGLKRIVDTLPVMTVSLICAFANLMATITLIAVYWTDDDIQMFQNNAFSVAVYWLWAAGNIGLIIFGMAIAALNFARRYNEVNPLKAE